MPCELVLGIDAGGSKTVAWLAAAQHTANEPLGQGLAGPANPQAIGLSEATGNLEQAVAAAFSEAGIKRQPASAAVVAVAGSDRPAVRQALAQWADRWQLARRFRVVHDALPVLAAGCPAGWGVALVAGTGSLAFGQSPHGWQVRAGGWGYLFGDEGSGYAIGRAALQAVAKAADGRGPATQLTAALLEKLHITRPEALVTSIYNHPDPRRQMAALAETVIQVAEQGDEVAAGIVDDAAGELAHMAAAVARKLAFRPSQFPLALAGGLLVHRPLVVQRLLDHLRTRNMPPERSTIVAQPVRGTVLLARQMAAAA